MIFRKKADVFFRGMGAEFAFKTDDGVLIVSGGQVMKLQLLASETAGQFKVVLGSSEKEHVIFTGGAEAAARRFIDISKSAVDGRSRVHVSRRGTVAILAAFAAFALAYSYLTTPFEPAQQDPGIKALMEAMPSASKPGELPLGIPPGLATALPHGIGGLAPSEQTEQLGTGSLIVDKPAYLSLPGEKPPATPTEKTEGVKDEISAIPAYSEDLYSKMPAPEAAARPETAAKDAAVTSAPKDGKSAADVVLPEKAETGAEAAGARPPMKQAVAVSSVPPVPAQATPGPTAQASQDTLTPDQAKKLAQAAVTNMISSGMTADQATAVMGRLENLNKMPPDQITPQMLEGLPHELVTLLKQAGVSDTAKQDGEGGVPYAMIRLPEGVIDQYRGKDGIPSIPTNDSYAALGNKITLQLPGGGDIKSPDDLKGFGFKP